MLMSELIQKHESNPGEPVETLVRALVKTGPIAHGGYIYTGTIQGNQTNLQKGNKAIADARSSTTVDVPAGSYPGIDAEQDALRGLAIALKTNSARILDLIDSSLDFTAGNDGLKGVLSLLQRNILTTEGSQTITGLQAIRLALQTIEEAAAKVGETLAHHEDSSRPTA